MTISDVVLYFHTLRYLKIKQIFWRIRYQLYTSSINLSQKPELRKKLGSWAPPARRRQSLIGKDKFRFLNMTGKISDVNWDGPQRGKLWRYNQHYFDDLNSIDSELRTNWHYALIQRWMKENLPAQGIGWDPYPTSLRIVNWLKWHMAGHSFDQGCIENLAVQTRWLSKNIEWHILGNHLFSNAKALVFSGLFFEGSEAKKWLNKGLEITANQLSEQVLSDGGHFERSPMYHISFLEDILDLINLSNAYPGIINNEHIKEWHQVASKMFSWLEGMCHSDGEIAFFNDASIGITPSPFEMRRYGDSLGIKPDGSVSQPGGILVHHFEETGYIRIQDENARLILDTAPIGPDYLPGHAHADTLSFELSLFGTRVLVNSGTSQYDLEHIRIQERGTKAHNTVVVNEQNSSEVWSRFRVARRAFPICLEINENKDRVCVTCAHDGYMRLDNKPIHKRTWEFSHEGLILRDEIKSKVESSVSFLHFHPLIEVAHLNIFSHVLTLPYSQHQVHISILCGSPYWTTSYFSPEFGIRIKNHCLAIKQQDSSDILVKFSWAC